MNSKFLTVLQTQDIDDNNFFILKDLIYQSRCLNGIVTVPKGFKSDGSSTPRVPVVYTLYGGKAHHEGVLHDYLYRVPNHTILFSKAGEGLENTVRVISKKEADTVFLEAMTARDKPWHVRWGMYLGVKFGGQLSWATGQARYEIVDLSPLGGTPNA